ncbi:MAG TPA: tRNA pseudouridine(38-40) synthase TruA [bacterium]|jgi:tRNA pseudouridine38-40 synthase
MDLNLSAPIDSDLHRQYTYRFDVEYDGTDFAGWQFQPRERTVQDCLQKAVIELFGEEVPVIGAGRTDAGVHATGQVAHFRVDSYREPPVVFRAMNALLPPDVRVRNVQLAESDFHARFSAQWRGYRYRIARRPIAIGRSYCWTCPNTLDHRPMHEAAQLILGSHRFRAFAHFNPKEVHYLSTVYRAEWIAADPFLEFRVEANRFLHGMVRLLVGTFVNIGRGKTEIERLKQIMAAEDVRQAGPKAPAAGLTLIKVGYEPWREHSQPRNEDSDTW